MTTRTATFFPQRVNLHVPNMRGIGAALGYGTEQVKIDLGAPDALDADVILDGTTVTTAGSTTTFNVLYTGSEAQMGKYGRSLSIVCSAANTAVIQVHGRDYLGQRMSESFTANGTTPVLGNKAFRYIDEVEWAAASTGTPTLDVGTNNKLGLPFRCKQMLHEHKNDIAAANAGTFTAGLATATAATATNADVRGTLLPVTVIPDGTNTFGLTAIVDLANGHGNEQYAA